MRSTLRVAFPSPTEAPQSELSVRGAAPVANDHAFEGSKSHGRQITPQPSTSAKKPAAKGASAQPVLLSGGNPQISKAYGDAPVQAYIAAMPGWKQDVRRRLDAIISHTVPGVRKSVKWNSPFYGVEDHVWFLSFHSFTRYVKVAFFRGASLNLVPPGKSKHAHVRYLDIYQDDALDETQLADWKARRPFGE